MLSFRHLTEGEKEYDDMKNHLEKMKSKAKIIGAETIQRPNINTDIIQSENLLNEMLEKRSAAKHTEDGKSKDPPSSSPKAAAAKDQGALHKADEEAAVEKKEEKGAGKGPGEGTKGSHANTEEHEDA